MDTKSANNIIRMLMLALLLISLVAAAAAEPIITQTADGIYQATVTDEYGTHTFPVYCMNHDKSWPDANADYAWQMIDLESENNMLGKETLKKVYRLLYAGYETNGMNLYTIGETPAITEAIYERILDLSRAGNDSFVVNYEEEPGVKPFAYLLDPDETIRLAFDDANLNKARKFLQKVMDTTVIKEVTDRAMIVGTPFYQAVLLLEQGNGIDLTDTALVEQTKKKIIAELAKQMAPSEHQMWMVTQAAMWQLLRDISVAGEDPKIEGNSFNFANAFPPAPEMVAYAKASTPPLLTGEPGPMRISGDVHFRYLHEEGRWSTREITILPERNYVTTYKLHLAPGMQVIGGDPDRILAGQPFRLVCDFMPSAEHISITTEVSWPSPLYYFTSTDASYQHMAGAYRMSHPLSLTLKVYASDKVNIPQTGDGTPLTGLMWTMLLSGCAMGLIGKRNRKAAA